MDISFWLQKWENNDISFHESDTNPLLVKHFKSLGLASGQRILLPLCGKTLDIAWLLTHGYQVVGIELSEMAIQQLFVALELKPTVVKVGKLVHYRAAGIDLFVGNIFDASKQIIGPVDGIYDRAALVALPGELRDRYSRYLPIITSTAAQLLITYEYDQHLMSGPPFSINEAAVRAYYGTQYTITLRESKVVDGGLKGLCTATENVWLLVPR